MGGPGASHSGAGETTDLNQRAADHDSNDRSPQTASHPPSSGSGSKFTSPPAAVPGWLYPGWQYTRVDPAAGRRDPAQNPAGQIYSGTALRFPCPALQFISPKPLCLISETEKHGRRRSKPDRIFSPVGPPPPGCTQISAILSKHTRNSHSLTTLSSNRFILNGLTDTPKRLSRLE